MNKIEVSISSSRPVWIEADADAFGAVFAGMNDVDQVAVLTAMVEHMRPHRIQWDHISIHLERPENDETRLQFLSVLFSEYHDALNSHASLTARVAELEAENSDLKKAIGGCQWYWPEGDNSSYNCIDSPFQCLEFVEAGTVVAVDRGGVVETRYYAALPPADDADSDDEFEVDEAELFVAEEKVAAELARRATLNKGASE